MTELDATKLVSQSTLHTQLLTMLALLKAFKLIELLTVVNNLLAMTCIALSSAWQLKLLALLVLAVGLLVIVVAIRIRIDIKLFSHWDSLDIAKLDEVLMMLNPKHQAGRALDARILGSYSLFKLGVMMMLVQSILLIIIIYN